MKKSASKVFRNMPLHLMLLPGVILCFIFCYIPMYGIVIAFMDFVPAKGLFGPQTWVGLKNFITVFNAPMMGQYIVNTITISLGKIILGVIVPVMFAILLNELKNKFFKRSVQTIIYFPYFLSWVIFAGILIDVLSPTTGIVNQFLKVFNINPIYFLGDPKYFQATVVITDVFKTFGFNTVIYLATISGIDPTLYEASAIDGAGRLKQTWHITLPSMRVMIALLSILALGNILNAGFEQVWSLLNPAVLEKGEILDTYIYRKGILSKSYGQAAAVGLVKSVISLALIGGSYFISNKCFNYRLF